jgi:hypothetical protein
MQFDSAQQQSMHDWTGDILDTKKFSHVFLGRIGLLSMGTEYWSMGIKHFCISHVLTALSAY